MKNILARSSVAGILIGLGVIINTQAPNPILGAFLFSFGLLTIIYMQLPLYTGKIGFLAPHLPIIFTGNIIGIILTIELYIFSNFDFLITLQDKANIKFSHNIISLFVSGFFCGMLIHFAVKQKQMIQTIMAIMIFILIGAEHCIADFPYFLMVSNIPLNYFKFIVIIIGNSLGALLIEFLLKNFDKKEKI
jgi:formate/nitrite transporter FocA (FNT family)